jgi:ribose transport system substrate-binding protein
MAIGAYQALLAAGIADRVKVFGFDGADEVVVMIRENKIVATGMQFPAVMAKTAAEFADAYFRGERGFAKKIPVAVEMVTRKNVANYYNPE